MHFQRVFATALAALALIATLTATAFLTGCSESDSGDGQHEVNYAKVYNPDGTLLVEGEYEYASYGSQVITIKIDGVKYQTSYNNVVTMRWYEEAQQ